MSRKDLYYTLDDKCGRDAGKMFHIREQPALRAEKWAIRAIGALLSSGVSLPDDAASLGMSGMARIGLEALARVPFFQAEPLLDELMNCVMIVPDPSRPAAERTLVEDDIEEITSFSKIRAEVFKLHADFFLKGRNSKPD